MAHTRPLMNLRPRSRPRIGLLVIAIVSLAAFAHAGCGGEDGALIDGGDAEAAAPEGTTGTAEPDPPSPSDAAGGPSPQDGGADGSRDAALVGVDGGEPPSPGAILCGGATCSVATQTCCRTIDGGASCTAKDACSGASVACDEKADCSGGAICCAGLGGRGASRCDDECGRLDTQLCRTNGECEDGVCYVNRCIGGAVVQACEKLLGCQQ